MHVARLLYLPVQVQDNWSNFEVYGLQPPVGLVRMDLHRHPFRASLEEARTSPIAHVSLHAAPACSARLTT
jgi:hypothetical protein